METRQPLYIVIQGASENRNPDMTENLKPILVDPIGNL